jgi:hypothetical protein
MPLAMHELTFNKLNYAAIHPVRPHISFRRGNRIPADGHATAMHDLIFNMHNYAAFPAVRPHISFRQGNCILQRRPGRDLDHIVTFTEINDQIALPYLYEVLGFSAYSNHMFRVSPLISLLKCCPSRMGVSPGETAG